MLSQFWNWSIPWHHHHELIKVFIIIIGLTSIQCTSSFRAQQQRFCRIRHSFMDSIAVANIYTNFLCEIRRCLTPFRERWKAQRMHCFSYKSKIDSTTQYVRHNANVELICKILLYDTQSSAIRKFPSFIHILVISTDKYNTFIFSTLCPFDVQ